MNITDQEFRTFSRLVGQGIFATPVQPARTGGMLSFDVGIASTLVSVDTGASYWKHSVGNDFSTSGYVAVPRLVVSKGFGSGTISGMYAKITDSGIKTYGGAIDLPIIRGTLATPEFAIRASYATLSGVDAFKEKVYGLEGFVSKGIGPFTPYVAVGRMRTNATGIVDTTLLGPPRTIKDNSNFNRYTAGVRLSLFVPKIVIEATQAEVRSYAAKISVGF